MDSVTAHNKALVIAHIAPVWKTLQIEGSGAAEAVTVPFWYTLAGAFYQVFFLCPTYFDLFPKPGGTQNIHL